MEYREYLQSVEWKTLRRVAKELAGHKCQLCDSSRGLNVHHRKYPDILGTEPIKDLVVLCEKCHSMFHGVSLPENKEKGCDGCGKVEDLHEVQSDLSGKRLYCNQCQLEWVICKELEWLNKD